MAYAESRAGAEEKRALFLKWCQKEAYRAAGDLMGFKQRSVLLLQVTLTGILGLSKEPASVFGQKCSFCSAI